MEVKDTVSLVLSILALVIPLIIFIVSSPEMITFNMLIVFIFTGIFLLIFSFIIYFIPGWRNINIDLKKNRRDVEEIKKYLKFSDLFKDMEVRLRILEANRKKKAQIDPRIIYWILILILLYLFLKFAGIVP